jgi:trimeric autotransporter adhesin
MKTRLFLVFSVLSLLPCAADVRAQVPGDERWSSRFGGYTDISGEVHAIATDSNGNIYMGGRITRAGGQPVNMIAKWNGASWESLGEGVNHTVYAITIDGDYVYVGGTFTEAGGDPAYGIARWNGETWEGLDKGAFESIRETEVHAVAVHGDEIYLGGRFYFVGQGSSSNVARWDGETWEDISNGFGRVYAFAVSESGDLYAGGAIRGGIQKWNGDEWAPLAEGYYDGVDGSVLAIAIDGEDIYIGGVFDRVDGGMGGLVGKAANNIIKWNGSEWEALGDGLGTNGGVNALAFYENDLYAGGNFGGATDLSFNNVAKWNGSAWETPGDGHLQINALAVGSDGVYAGGRISLIGGQPVESIARWDGVVWQSIGTGFSGGVNARVADLFLDGSDLYAVGWFSQAGNERVHGVARWDGTEWERVGDEIDGDVERVIVEGGNVYVAGSPLYVGGDTTLVARWDGMEWEALGSRPIIEGLSNIDALSVQGNDVYVGDFGGDIARWNGSAWERLRTPETGPNGTEQVYVITAHGTDIYAGGKIYLDGAEVGIIKWNGTAWEALGGGLQGVVLDIEIVGGEVYVAGNFEQVGGVTANNVAKWNGTTWETFGDGVEPVAGAMAVSGGSIYVGDVEEAGGQPVNWVAKWNGEAWEPLGSGVGDFIEIEGEADAEIWSIVADGNQIYVGGRFASAGGRSSNNIALWTEPLLPDGEVPSELTLEQNYPNPAQAFTNVQFWLPEPAHVTINLYDARGRVVSTPVDQDFPAGLNLVELDVRGLLSGTYFYRLEAGGEIVTRTIVVVK